MSDSNEQQAPQEGREAPAGEPVAQPALNPIPRVIAFSDAEVERQMRWMSRRSFLWAGAAVVTGYAGWHWLITRRPEGDIPWPFRSALEVNEGLARDYFRGSRLAPTFSRAEATEPRVNGDIGLPDDFDPAGWKLQVIGLADTSRAQMMPTSPSAAAPNPKDPHTLSAGPADSKKVQDKKAPAGKKRSEDAVAAANQNHAEPNGADEEDTASNSDDGDTSDMAPEEPVGMLTLADIQRLPRVEMVTELKCIEGWSTIVRWAGARFADFVAHYPLARTDSGELPAYVALETPDGGYYVGLDMESALHPQTLLCYEMNGKPLPLEHGGPLRLVIPVKYGIKNLKRIGTIRFTDSRPRDYWAEQGYDWYAGH
ncbi:MAG TPA: molybdopterin-dependent oxidoreductase [Chthonomonadaceae bacterium]|nr:molybdopterin-dependent oxidoreductase [Chthonomonadaceae bacterium]